MKILYYNPAPTQKRFIPFQALRGSAFFRRPNYDAMRVAYLCRDHDFHYYDERIEDTPHIVPDIIVANVPLYLAQYVKNLALKKWPRKTTFVLHGYYPTLYPKDKYPRNSSIVVGDIANIWHTIQQDWERHSLKQCYVSHRKDVFNTTRSIEEHYGFTPILSQLRTSFGCTCKSHNKDYCTENIIYKEFQQWDMDSAVHDIASIRRKIIFIRDDDFLHSKDYALSLLDRCWRYKKMWIFQTGGDLFEYRDVIKLLETFGVRIIHLKEDWLSDTIHEHIDDKAFMHQKQREIRMLHRKRIACGCMLRLGKETEDATFYDKLLHFLLKIKIDFIKVNVRMPIPHTRTYRKYARQKRIVDDLQSYDQWMPVIKNQGQNSHELYSWMEKLRDRFYSWDSILLRNTMVSTQLGFYNSILFNLIPNLSYRNNFLEKVGYPP